MKLIRLHILHSTIVWIMIKFSIQKIIPEFIKRIFEKKKKKMKKRKLF